MNTILVYRLKIRDDSYRRCTRLRYSRLDNSLDISRDRAVLVRLLSCTRMLIKEYCYSQTHPLLLAHITTSPILVILIYRPNKMM